MNEHETIADIIGKIRAEADLIEENARGSLKAGENYDGIAFTESDLESALDLAETKRQEADRLEAAHKRERGDCAKLREAVKAVVDVGYPHNFQREAPHIRGYCYDITRAIEKCFAALAAPPRNCDVGTAKEQAERLNAFCDSHGHGFDGQKCYCCENCSFISVDRCELAWAQLPCESEVAK